MDRFFADFSRYEGPVKPMHSVNNGPAGSRGNSNAYFFEEAGIPYARLHDSAFNAGYGGSHSVDVIALFPNFDADENDPASYDFTLTDEYLKRIDAVGTKIFYRLGSKIEHESKKYGTLVPKDFAKWARICEHIIRHYNEGWADGLRLNIEYWEIWNEPDCRNADGSNPCWQGTDEQFCELFYVALKYLKEQFPKLKIGGPAFCYVNEPFTEKLLERLTRDGGRVPLDFYSFHGYDCEPSHYDASPRKARELLDRFGYTDTELILNEWNYVRHWTPASEINYSYKALRGIKGASYIAAVMSVCQKTPLDHLMYYDARPTVWNGLFESGTMEPYKGSYALRMFGDLYRLGGAAECGYEGDIYGCAACGSGEAAVMLTRYNNEDSTPDADVTVELRGLPERCEISYYLLDKDNDLTKIRTDHVFGGRFTTIVPMKVFDSLKLTVKTLTVE